MLWETGMKKRLNSARVHFHLSRLSVKIKEMITFSDLSVTIIDFFPHSGI